MTDSTAGVKQFGQTAHKRRCALLCDVSHALWFCVTVRFSHCRLLYWMPAQQRQLRAWLRSTFTVTSQSWQYATTGGFCRCGCLCQRRECIYSCTVTRIRPTSVSVCGRGGLWSAAINCGWLLLCQTTRARVAVMPERVQVADYPSASASSSSLRSACASHLSSLRPACGIHCHAVPCPALCPAFTDG
mgnify:CR=1 FL=1